jgi:hypothetical protein
MPEPEGIAVADAERMLAGVVKRSDLLGAGFSGLIPDERNLAPLERLCSALAL